MAESSITVTLDTMNIDFFCKILTSIHDELKAIREQKVNITVSGNCSVSKEESLNSIPFNSLAISPQAEPPPLRDTTTYA